MACAVYFVIIHFQNTYLSINIPLCVLAVNSYEFVSTIHG
jgi:hypothetical protein